MKIKGEEYNVHACTKCGKRMFVKDGIVKDWEIVPCQSCDGFTVEKKPAYLDRRIVH